MNSGHIVEVVEVEFEPHPAADRLSIVKIGANRIVANTQDWLDIGGGTFPKTAIWIPPDSLVDENREEFSFLKKE